MLHVSRFSQSKSETSRGHFEFFSQSILINLCQHGEAQEKAGAGKVRIYDLMTSLSNTLAETGHSHVLDRICFESITNMGVESYFKRMRADHEMPTVANYPYRRVRCVEDDMLRISHISLCAIHFIRRKLSKVNPQNIKPRPNKQSAIIEGTGSKDEDKRRETVMRGFAGEY